MYVLVAGCVQQRGPISSIPATLSSPNSGISATSPLQAEGAQCLPVASMKKLEWSRSRITNLLDGLLLEHVLQCSQQLSLHVFPDICNVLNDTLVHSHALL